MNDDDSGGVDGGFVFFFSPIFHVGSNVSSYYAYLPVNRIYSYGVVVAALRSISANKTCVSTIEIH